MSLMGFSASVQKNRDKKPSVSNKNGELTVNSFDQVLQMPVGISADAFFLITAIEPNYTTPFVDLFKCSSNTDSFLMEACPKLRPVDSTVDGAFFQACVTTPTP